MSSEVEVLTGIVRGVMAGVLLLTFIGLCCWVLGPGRQAGFESAALLPLEEDFPGDVTK